MPEPMYYSDLSAPAPAPVVVAKDPAKESTATTPTVVNTPAGTVIGTTTTTVKDAEAQKSATDALNVFFANRDKLAKDKATADLNAPWNSDDTGALLNDLNTYIANIIDIWSNSKDIKGTNDDKWKGWMGNVKIGISTINDIIQKVLITQSSGGLKGYFRKVPTPSPVLA